MSNQMKAERNTELRKLLDDNPYICPQIRDHVYELLEDSDAFADAATDAVAFSNRLSLAEELLSEKDEEIVRLRAALERMMPLFKELMASYGGVCEHDIGICWCAELEAFELGQAALAQPAESKEQE